MAWGFTEYHDLEGAFGRRAVTERANGILMERHSVDEAQAFGLLRDQSRRTNLKLADIAAAATEQTTPPAELGGSSESASETQCRYGSTRPEAPTESRACVASSFGGVLDDHTTMTMSTSTTTAIPMIAQSINGGD